MPVLAGAPIAVRKHHGPSRLGRKGLVLLTLPHDFTEGRQGRNLEARADAEAVDLLAGLLAASEG